MEVTGEQMSQWVQVKTDGVQDLSGGDNYNNNNNNSNYSNNSHIASSRPVVTYDDINGGSSGAAVRGNFSTTDDPIDQLLLE